MGRRTGVIAAALGLALVATASGGPAPKRSPAQLRVLTARAITLEKEALENFDKNPAAAQAALRQSLLELQNAEASSSLDDKNHAESASLRQAINKDEIAIRDFSKNPGRARAKINEAIVAKEKAITGYTGPVSSNPPPDIGRVRAEFDSELRETEYSLQWAFDPLNPRANNLTYSWELTPPVDDPECDNDGKLTGHGKTFIWEHGEEDGCTHDSPEHNGLVTVEVSDGTWICEAGFFGTLNDDGPKPKPCKRKPR